MGVPAPTEYLGRKVFLDEMAKFAKRGHRACLEHPGYVVRLRDGRRFPEPCECSIKRFKVQHDGDVYYDFSGELRWKPFRSPEYLGFIRIFEASVREFQDQRAFAAWAQRTFINDDRNRSEAVARAKTGRI